MITIEAIKKATAEYFNITIRDLENKDRYQSLVYARQIAIYLCCALLKDYSLKQIGRQFNRDHTTIMHSRNVVRGYLTCLSNITVAETRNHIENIKDLIISNNTGSNQDKDVKYTYIYNYNNGQFMEQTYV